MDCGGLVLIFCSFYAGALADGDDVVTKFGFTKVDMDNLVAGHNAARSAAQPPASNMHSLVS
jgi:hypothetical protein